MHVRTDPILEDYKNSLETREATFTEQAKFGNRISSLGMLMLLFGFVLPLILTSQFKAQQVLLLGLAALGFCIALLLVYWGRYINDKKGIPRLPTQYLTSDEKIFLRVFKSLTNLADYLNVLDNGREDSRKSEPLRIQALECMRETYRALNYAWQPIDVKVVMKEIGNNMEDFKEEFWRSLIYTVESATKKETVEKTFNILARFAYFLMDPSKEILVKINQDIKLEQGKGQLSRTDKLNARYPILETFLTHGIPQHLAIIGTIFAVAFLSAFIPFWFAHIDINTALIVFGAIFGPSLAVYLELIFRQWKPKS